MQSYKYLHVAQYTVYIHTHNYGKSDLVTLLDGTKVHLKIEVICSKTHEKK